jgi:hypothetical protein
MNRTYHPEQSYIAQSEAFRAPMPREAHGISRAAETVLGFFDLAVGFLSSSAVRSTLRILSAVLCFFIFLFVIGAVEAGSLSFGGGVLASVLLCSAAYLLVLRPKRSDR